MVTLTGVACSCFSATRRTKLFPRFGRTRTVRVCAGFFRHLLTPSSVEGSRRAGNLFGRRFCPFAPGFRKANGNGLFSACDSAAALPALQSSFFQFLHCPPDRSLCTLAVLGHHVLLSEHRRDCDTVTVAF